MLLVAHIFFAICGIGSMLWAVVYRLRNCNGNHLVQLSATSFAGLVASGMALVIIDHGQIMGACLEGLLYFGVLAALYGVYRSLAID